MHTIYPIGMLKLGLLVPLAAINDPIPTVADKDDDDDNDDGDGDDDEYVALLSSFFWGEGSLDVSWSFDPTRSCPQSADEWMIEP